jgi:hypothetical protein
MNGENRRPIVGVFVKQCAELKLAQGFGERVEVAGDFRRGLGVVSKEPAEFDRIVEFLFSRGKARGELLQGIDLGKGFLGRALVVPEIGRGGFLF